METQPNPISQTPAPPPGHDKMIANLRRSLSVPKAEIDRREAEWRKQQDEKKQKRQKP